MKALRDKAKAAESAKLSRLGGGKSSGGDSSCHPGRKGYATGGSVGGQDIGGMPSKPNLSRPGRSMGGKKPGGKKGGGKTNVNVIVMGKEGAGEKPPMAPPLLGPPPGPAPMPPKMPPPMPPDMGPPPGGPGGPPPMMRAKGGRVNKAGGGAVKVKHIGKVKMDEGAGGGLGRLAKTRKYGA